MPCSDLTSEFAYNKCVGKNVADTVESLICALYMSSNLKSAL